MHSGLAWNKTQMNTAKPWQAKSSFFIQTPCGDHHQDKNAAGLQYDTFVW